jgi:hypothetical protein
MVDKKQIESEALSIPGKAKALAIVDNATYQQAGEMLITIKSIRKQVDASFDPIIKAAHNAHKAAVAEKKRIEEPLATAEGILKPAMAAWNQKQEDARRAEEARLQALAIKAEEDRRLAAAATAQAAGDTRAADAALAEPITAPTVVIASTTPKLEGVSFTARWTFQIVDASLIPREFLMPDEKRIGQYVRAMKDARPIPGVKIYSEQVVTGRA